jgi:hypothetical protein
MKRLRATLFKPHDHAVTTNVMMMAALLLLVGGGGGVLAQPPTTPATQPTAPTPTTPTRLFFIHEEDSYIRGVVLRSGSAIRSHHHGLPSFLTQTVFCFICFLQI